MHWNMQITCYSLLNVFLVALSPLLDSIDCAGCLYTKPQMLFDTEIDDRKHSIAISIFLRKQLPSMSTLRSIEMYRWHIDSLSAYNRTRGHEKNTQQTSCVLSMYLNRGNLHMGGLMQERPNSSVFAMELRLSCTNPSIFPNVCSRPYENYVDPICVSMQICETRCTRNSTYFKVYIRPHLALLVGFVKSNA